jgi:hypothetical protein
MPMDLCLGKIQSIFYLNFSIFNLICAYIKVCEYHHDHEVLFKSKVYLFKVQNERDYLLMLELSTV